MRAAMDRIRAFFAPAKDGSDGYEPLVGDDAGAIAGSAHEDETPFSWVEYSIFALIGVAMLWAWNMFLAAAPYFQTRFQSDPWIVANSQSAILTTSTCTSLVAMLILANIQSSANYPLRINAALVLNAVVFGLLALSTSSFLDVSPPAYLAFVLLMVAVAAWATGLMQNGAFSFAASFGRPEYTQAIMAGQGVAGILPPLTQMVSFLAFSGAPAGVPPGVDPSSSPSPSSSPPGGGDDDSSGRAACVYFLTAVLVSAVALLGFAPLVGRHARLTSARRLSGGGEESEGPQTPANPAAQTARRHVPISTLFSKLSWLAAAVFLCFAITMFFPVFTAKILSVNDDPQVAPGGGGSSSDTGSSRLFRPGAFIPLAFFVWNLGDLAGRVSTVAPLPLLSPLARRFPPALFALALARAGFLPLYLLCNLHGRGAAVQSDLFYLAAVQFPFGLTNGWLGSSAMMAAGEWVAEDERAAAGGFMGMCLVAGLAAGSLLSFTAAGI